MIFNPLNAPKTALIKLTLFSLGWLALAAQAQNIDPLKFEKGSISGKVQGTLKPKQSDHWYQFNAQKGQYAVINLTPKPNLYEFANVGVLHMPSGKQDGTKGGIVYQGCLPETGTYKLRIGRNLMATSGGRAGYQAEVVILPVYASQALCN